MAKTIIESTYQTSPFTHFDSEGVRDKRKQVECKTGKVNVNLFHSYIAAFVSKVAVYTGIGAAIVTFSPSAIVIPTLFAAKFLAIATFTIPVIAIVTSVGAALFILELARKKKEFLYEISLLFTLTKGKDWWNSIDSDIVLSAIPLGPEHAKRLQTEEKIGAVLSMLEDFEVEKGLVEPISSQQWKNLGVTHCHIKAVDFTGVPVDQIQQGVEFVENQIQKGKRVCIHCKAGRGRSATIVVAYLLKKQFGGT
jgi:atypical dual specificity phosphatase